MTGSLPRLTSQKTFIMDVTTSYWRQFYAFARNQRRRSRNRTARLLAQALPMPPARKPKPNPVASNAPRREARFTVH